jgi:hypothetical protein
MILALPLIALLQDIFETIRILYFPEVVGM